MSIAGTIDLARPVEFKKTIVQVMGASLVLALFSQISIPLFFTPVLLSLQTLGLLLIGAFLGKKKGSWAVLTYLAEGAIGLPVFASGASGLGRLLGPSGGYLIGFVLVTYLAGLFVEKRLNLGSLFLSLLLASFAVFLTGLPWLALWIGTKNAISLGLIPFLIGDLIKVAIATCCIGIARK